MKVALAVLIILVLLPIVLSGKWKCVPDDRQQIVDEYMVRKIKIIHWVYVRILNSNKNMISNKGNSMET
jgi:hypothetical protein